MSESNADYRIACQHYVEVIKLHLNREIPLATKVTVILGNVSCDLDSAVSSLVYAFFLSWKKAQWQTRKECEERYNALIPVLNIPRADYELKTEVTHSFRQMGIDPQKLVFRDEIDLELLHSKDQLNLILVDHHVLSESDKSLASCVIEILDHRPKDENNWLYNDSINVTIRPVGSCATLVCEKILDDSIHGMRFLKLTDVAKLLYPTIILDTVNFSTKACRGTPIDLYIVEELEKILEITEVETNRAKTLNMVQEAKSNVLCLTAEQLLKKDAKTVGPIFIPGFPLLVEEYLKKDNVKETLKNIADREGMEVILLLGVKIEGENIDRDLAVYSRRRYKDMALKMTEALKNSQTTDLQLEQKLCNLSCCVLFKQNNLKATRKQIIPIIKEFLKT